MVLSPPGAECRPRAWVGSFWAGAAAGSTASWASPATISCPSNWSRPLAALSAPSRGAVYLNFISDEGADRVVVGYGRENHTRLAKVKAQYDPDNVFHLNHNIQPA
jgi:hypothetical protein